jgi:hypothetical protein
MKAIKATKQRNKQKKANGKYFCIFIKKIRSVGDENKRQRQIK